jgi:mannose-1-phosphate guanylyltransferase/phosphomannomutase
MKAMILAAGKGVRLRPLTWTLPKPMLPVGGRPLLEHHIDLLRAHGVTDITINLHHKPEVIREHFGNGSWFGVRISYSYEESLLGSAGAIKKVESTFDAPFFILYGDVLLDLDLTTFAAFHRARGAALTMAVCPTEEPTRCGIALMDEDGRVRRFREKPADHEVFSDWASAGAFVAEPDVLRLVPQHAPFDIGGDLIPRLIDLGWPVYGYAGEGYFLDIGSPERYRQALRDMAEGCVRTPVALQTCHLTSIPSDAREVSHVAH